MKKPGTYFKLSGLKNFRSPETPTGNSAYRRGTGCAPKCLKCCHKLFAIIILCLINSLAGAQNDSGNRLLVGAAEAVINPPVNSFLAGYDQNRKSTGVHDDLYVKAVVVANRQNALALVTIDCIGLPYPALQKIRDAVEQLLPAENFNTGHIVVSSTHTHAGPDVIGIWGKDRQTTGADSAYLHFLIHTSAATIVKAWKHRRNAIVQYANTVFGEGWVKNVSDSAEIDHTVSVLQFTTRRGRSIATLTNFACHPTFLGRENTLVSADFPSGFYTQMKKLKRGVHLFVQGAIGGWIQPEKVTRTFGEAEKKGAELAWAATAALAKPTLLQGTAIHFDAIRFEIPVSNQGLGLLAESGVINRDVSDGTPTEIAWFSIGNAVFATHPGETSPVFAYATKRLMKTTGPKFIIGLGQDELGYILKPDFFKPGTRLHAAGYLTSMSPGEKAGPAMMQVLEELAEKHSARME